MGPTLNVSCPFFLYMQQLITVMHVIDASIIIRRNACRIVKLWPSKINSIRHLWHVKCSLSSCSSCNSYSIHVAISLVRLRILIEKHKSKTLQPGLFLTWIWTKTHIDRTSVSYTEIEIMEFCGPWKSMYESGGHEGGRKTGNRLGVSALICKCRLYIHVYI